METDGAVDRCLRPTSLLPFVAWGLLLFMQIVSPARAWSWPLVGLGVMLCLGYAWARVLRDRVTLSRHTTAGWVVVGDPMRERFTLTNEGILPALWARMVDESAVPGYRADRVESVGAHASRSWTSGGLCERRGVFRVGPTELRMADPLGLFEVVQRYPATTTLMVYPRASHLPHLDLPRGRASSRSATVERAAAETITVGGLRTYVPGESLRRVHWPASAHHDRLMVREFDREPSGDLWLVLDMDRAVQAGRGSEATQEYVVILAASLAARFSREGERRAVGLVASGSDPVLLAPTRGQAGLWRILEALARVEPGSGPSFSSMLDELRHSIGSGRTVVAITPSQDPAWVASLLALRERGNAPAVLLLDGATFDPPSGLPEAFAGLRALLATQRIPSYVIEQGFPFRPLDRIRRQRRELRTLPGTGRVIQVEVEEEV